MGKNRILISENACKKTVLDIDFAHTCLWIDSLSVSSQIYHIFLGLFSWSDILPKGLRIFTHFIDMFVVIVHLYNFNNIYHTVANLLIGSKIWQLFGAQISIPCLSLFIYKNLQFFCHPLLPVLISRFPFIGTKRFTPSIVVLWKQSNLSLMLSQAYARLVRFISVIIHLSETKSPLM